MSPAEERYQRLRARIVAKYCRPPSPPLADVLAELEAAYQSDAMVPLEPTPRLLEPLCR